MKQRLDMQVAAAVGAMLVGREVVTLEDVASWLPAHIRAAQPSLRAIAKALTGAGWEARRQSGGSVVYVPAGADAAAIGHNGDPGEMGDQAGAEVRGLLERIERLTGERKSLTDDIRDVFAEAKSRGFDVKALRGILRIRRKPREQQQEEEAIMEVYMRALGMMA